MSCKTTLSLSYSYALFKQYDKKKEKSTPYAGSELALTYHIHNFKFEFTRFYSLNIIVIASTPLSVANISMQI